jgi:hypothetical protein
VVYLIMVNYENRLPGARLPACLAILVVLGAHSAAQPSSSAPAAPGIQDNSFLVEEAYNQNFGVVQHISSFTRFFDRKTGTTPSRRNGRCRATSVTS